MSTHRPEVADVLRTCASRYLESYAPSAEQRDVITKLTSCRTAVLGGHKLRCGSCGHEEISYNSCRDRHCPKCQGCARAQWLAEREEELLDVPYYHVVFTLPRPIAPLALQNKRELYAILFRSVSKTLQTIAKDPEHLGAQIGFLAVLHTWGQNMLHHPHVHCVVPGGGISLHDSQWISCRDGFFLPVRVLSSFFRREFLDQLEKSLRKHELSFHGKLESLALPEQQNQMLSHLRSVDWVVYAKPPFGGPLQVLKYLARYTHRVAISNQRLISFEDDKVSFRWKDYQGNRQRVMSLDALEFCRRFLLHVLPKGFNRIRHYGFLANPVRKKRLPLIRALIAAPAEPRDDTAHEPQSHVVDRPERQCPACGEGLLRLVGQVLPSAPASAPELVDTS